MQSISIPPHSIFIGPTVLMMRKRHARSSPIYFVSTWGASRLEHGRDHVARRIAILPCRDHESLRNHVLTVSNFEQRGGLRSCPCKASEGEFEGAPQMAFYAALIAISVAFSALMWVLFGTAILRALGVH